MSVECPFSLKTVNEKIVRLVALLTVLLMLAGITSGALKWISLFLCVDFFLRGFTESVWSPVRRAATALFKIFRLKPKMINAGPKIFAAKIGFVVTAIITLLAFTGLTTAAQILAGILILLAALEAFAGICVGCHLYSLTQTIKKTFHSKAN